MISMRLAEAAHALSDVAPGVLELSLQRVVTTRFQSGGLPEDEALRLIGRLGDLAAVWDAIPDSAKSGLVAAIGRRAVQDLTSDGILSTAQANADASAAVDDRLLRLSPFDAPDLLAASGPTPGRTCGPTLCASLRNPQDGGPPKTGCAA
jgi:hypothetical protein